MAVFNTATLTGTFQSLNGSGFGDDIKMLKMYNGGNQGVTLSYGGVLDEDYAPPSSTFVFDVQANHADNASSGAGTLNGRKGQIIWGRGTAGVGNLYIIGYR